MTITASIHNHKNKSQVQQSNGV